LQLLERLAASRPSNESPVRALARALGGAKP
jgi:hypothetical protein